jgi:hypothetical protein
VKLAAPLHPASDPGVGCALETAPPPPAGVYVRVASPQLPAPPRLTPAPARVTFAGGCSLGQRIVPLLPGQPLVIASLDGLDHRLTAQGGQDYKYFARPEDRQRPFLQRAPDVPGTYTVMCDLHPRPCGVFVVNEQPYFTVTDNDGTFGIVGVPPGRFLLTAWDDRAGEKTAAVDVVAGEITYAKIVLPGGPPEPAGTGRPLVTPERGGCALATGDSRVARACAKGGIKQAKAEMKEMVKEAKAAGVKMECDDCHKDDSHYDQLTADAKDKLKKLLAAIDRR